MPDIGRCDEVKEEMAQSNTAIRLAQAFRNKRTETIGRMDVYTQSRAKP